MGLWRGVVGLEAAFSEAAFSEAASSKALSSELLLQKPPLEVVFKNRSG
jgi:hypothetical protein